MDHVLSSLALSLGSHYRVHYFESLKRLQEQAQSKGQMLDLFFFTSHSVRWLSSASQLPSLPYFQEYWVKWWQLSQWDVSLCRPVHPHPGRSQGSPDARIRQIHWPQRSNLTKQQVLQRTKGLLQAVTLHLLCCYPFLTLLMYPTYNSHPLNTLSFASYLANTYRPLISSQPKHPAFTILNSSQPSPLPKQVLGQSSDRHTRL